MKNILLAILLGLIILPVAAQVNDLKVVASAGASQQVGNFELDWTLGEPIILTLENPPVLISEGFHQPVYDFISAVEKPAYGTVLQAFPNPCQNELNISVQFPVSVFGYISFYDMSGKCVAKESFTGSFIEKQYNSSALPSGKYECVVSIPAFNERQIISIIKI